MRNIIAIFLMLLLPSLAMAQGQITRPEKQNPVTHKHSINGPKNCKDCNRLRAQEQERIAAQKRREEQRRREREQRLEEERRAEQKRIAEERRREEERRLAEERRAEQERIAEERRREEERRLAEERKRKAEEEARLTEQKRIIDNLVNNMVYVSGGTFTMGATSEQGSDAWDSEKPTHSVTLSSYYIGRYEVTQAEWKAVMGGNPSHFKGDNLPVEKVSWNDCQEFIRKLNSLTGKNFRLPTEAEWEFAARGGNNSRGYKYSGSNDISSVAWYTDNSGSKTHPVGQKSPNELGLYDMAGNVWEWCQDWYGKYSSSSQTNPTGPSSDSFRVFRGGSWGSNAGHCRVSGRYFTPYYGFSDLGLRLAEGIIPKINNTEISGRVVDENNEPLIGASIIVLNTNIRTVSDIDGNFFLTTTSLQNPMIKISYIGYKDNIIQGTSIKKDIKMVPRK